MSPAPAVEIGSTDEEDPALLFSQVRSLDRQSDGSIVVVDGLSNEVRIFDRSGRHLSTSGGSGTGPGEFTMANLIVGLPGDSILVHDQILARLSLFRPDGTHERTEQLTALPGFSPLMTPLGLAPDGALVVRGVHDPPPPSFGPGLVEATAYLGDLDEGRMDALSGVPFALGATDEQGQPRPVFPMAVPIQAVSPGGLWVTVPPEPEIKKIGWSGSVERIIRFPDARLALTSEERRGIVAWQRARLTSAQLDGAPEPAVLPSLPAFLHLVSDREGHLWVQESFDNRDPDDWEFGAPRGSAVWRVLSPEGEWLGSVRMPDRFRPMAIGIDWVLGVKTDDLDVEFVRLYGLSRN
ncbi:MAG: hypothetical protein EA422_01010 [Gemmatimonadales bacterium]|nr:MAG: hypothetical protein EA422_01010 [Gemmatimonadales bacterium]